MILFYVRLKRVIKGDSDRGSSFFGISFPLGALFDQADGFLVAFGAERFFNFDINGVPVLIHFKRNR